MPPQDRAPLIVDDELADRLRALLTLDGEAAQAVRERTPARRRPLRQVGPSASYGGDPD